MHKSHWYSSNTRLFGESESSFAYIWRNWPLKTKYFTGQKYFMLGNEYWLVFLFHFVYVLAKQEEKLHRKRKLRCWLMGMRKNFTENILSELSKHKTRCHVNLRGTSSKPWRFMISWVHPFTQLPNHPSLTGVSASFEFTLKIRERKFPMRNSKLGKNEISFRYLRAFISCLFDQNH